jgi:BirA family biotin operon repressor/biotin-[acetyl-CoA-carboxylase] ligase
MSSNLSMDQFILKSLYGNESKKLTVAELARELNVSQAQIFNRLELFQKLGYNIENHPSQGLRVISSPDTLIADDLRGRLEAANERSSPVIGNKILVFESTSSTNDVIQRLANEGQKEGLVVFAENQTNGRGRHGRVWFSPPRKGLWFSILVRPKIDTASFPRLTILSAVAVASALQKVTGLELKVKWPNDILCQGKKLAGILVELHADSKQISHAVIGLGININVAKEDFPLELQDRSTSLKAEAGKDFNRPHLAVQILQALDHYYSIIENDEFSYVMENWLDLDCTLGKQVNVQWSNGRQLKGLAANFDPDRALLVRSDDGMIERVTAGEVSLEKM